MLPNNLLLGENFEVNDKVYVLFPVKQIGQIIKVMLLLEGPLKVNLVG